jgi:FHS family L-fucose permease-like MFS transporter
VFALPILAVIVRAGYMRSIALGLMVMVLGCAAFVYTQLTPVFTAVLAALLLLSVGITFLQIASNAVITIAGPSDSAASRLTLLQGFNSLGTVLGPLLCAQFLLPDAQGKYVGGVGSVAVPFVISGLVLTLLSAAFAIHRNMLGDPSRAAALPVRSYAGLFRADRRLRLGTLAMFAYVGAEVTIGSLLTNYLMLPQTIGVAPATAGQMVFAVGVGAGALTIVGALASGVVGAVALLLVGLCNAIMYPTIYALALPDAPDEVPVASMFLCIAVVGGAILPYLTGILADHLGLGMALLLPAACYLGIAWFGQTCLQARTAAV